MFYSFKGGMMVFLLSLDMEKVIDDLAGNVDCMRYIDVDIFLGNYIIYVGF